MRLIPFIAQVFLSLWRDIKSGQMTLLASCLIIAVSATTTVGFFIERIDKLLRVQSNEMIAGDLRISSFQPIPEAVLKQAETYALSSAHYLLFSAMVMHNGEFTRADVKAVDRFYPLRGALKGRGADDVEARVIHSPAVGEVYFDAMLMAKLDLTLGARIVLGNAEFLVTKVLTFEPDRGGGAFNIAPRILMNRLDVAKTGLVVAGSRASHVVLFTGSAQAISDYKMALPEVDALRVQTIKDAEPTLKVTLERAERFMRLAAMIALLISACGIALSAHEFAKSRWDMVAIMRTFGMGKNFIFAYFTGALLVIGFLCGLVGSLIAYGVQALMVGQLSGLLLNTTLPKASVMPAFIGVGVSVLITLGFALPAFYQLRTIPPMRVLRRSMDPLSLSRLYAYGPALLVIMGLCFWQARSLTLGGLFIIGFLVSITLLVFSAKLFLLLLSYIPRHHYFYMGGKNVLFRAKTALLQITVIGFGLVVIMLLMVVRNDLIDLWKLSVPKDAPNQFAVNIPESALSNVNTWLAANGVKDYHLYPMIGGRITKHNAKDFDPEHFTDPEAKRLARRQFNLSWAQTLPSANAIVQGAYTQTSALNYPAISVEDKLAERFGFKLGDTLDFLLNGEEVRTQITSIRTVDWQSVQVNFFILFNEDVFKMMPSTWITAFYWPPEQNTMLLSLVKAAPELTLLDVGEIVRRIHDLIDKVTLGISFIFAFSLVAAFLVFIIVIQSTRSARIHEIAVYRTFGLTAKKIKQGLLGEFMIIGAVSGLIAGIIALGLSMLAMWLIFDVISNLSFGLLVVSLMLGTFGVGFIGYTTTKKYINISPMKIVRHGS